MNIVFFGTSEFALMPLRAILGSRHEVSALVTQPDKKKGRKLVMSPPPTKVLALTKGVPVYQPDDASGMESLEYLAKLKADLFVVVSFGQILKKEVLDIPKFCSINLHGSLLPKYRGAAPTNWAIINGDKSTGVTVIRMNEKMDEGDIMLKSEIPIEDEDTNITLSEKLSELGAKLLLEAMDLIADKKEKLIKQDGSKATYAAKLKKEDGLIDWNEPAIKIHNKTRGLIPWPGAYTYMEGGILKMLNTEVVPPSDDGAGNGEIVDIVRNKGIIVRTGSGSLAIKYLQIEGKKVMDADSFARGHRMVVKGYRFGQ